MLREIIESIENVDEGKIFDKVRKWLINNIDPITKKYISYSSAYANQRIVIERPDKNIKFLQSSRGFVYMNGVSKSGKEFFLMTDESTIDSIKDLITGEYPIRLMCAKMSDFENNGVVPYYIYRAYES